LKSLAKGYFTGAKRAAGAFIIFSIGSSFYQKYKAWQVRKMQSIANSKPQTQQCGRHRQLF
jgi:hypothetical protein